MDAALGVAQNRRMPVSRRSVLAALPLLGCASEADARANTFYVAPNGAGAGSSWSDAAPLGNLSELLSNVEPGGEVLVAADLGAYAITEPVDISAGGVKGADVSVRGVSSRTGEAMSAVVQGDRGDGDAGTSAFRLARGAGNLRFSHFSFRDVGNGAFAIVAPVSNLTIEDCSFENVYRFLENTAGGGEGHASMRDFVVRRCAGVRAERGFLRIRYNARGGLIEDCRGEGQANQGGFIPVGCALDDRASAITYRRCVMAGFQQLNAGDYWNGDGFSDEPGNRNIRYEACEARGSTDGGFDCKSRDVVLQDCIAEDNKRNFRIWDERGTLSGCISRNPNFRGRAVEQASPCHLWIGGEEGTRIEVDNFTVEDADATPIIQFDHDVARVEIRGITIRSPRVNWGDDEERIRAGMLLSEEPAAED
ncbi:MAG: hypothetical protein AB7H66_13565 [Hyphomonadaceae bacterium]